MGCPDCTPCGTDCRGPLARHMKDPEDYELECDCDCHRCKFCGSPYCECVGGREKCQP